MKKSITIYVKAGLYTTHANHVSPNDPVRGFHDLDAKIFIPMHHGTFDVSNEPVGEPLRIIHKMEDERKIQGKVKALNKIHLTQRRNVAKVRRG